METNNSDTWMYYHDVENEPISLYELKEGDTFVMRVNWYGGRTNNIFEVTEEVADFAKEAYDKGRKPMAEVHCKGKDGHSYKIYCDIAHIECFTDEKDGFDRGTKASRPKLID